MHAAFLQYEFSYAGTNSVSMLFYGHIFHIHAILYFGAYLRVVLILIYRWTFSDKSCILSVRRQVFLVGWCFAAPVLLSQSKTFKNLKNKISKKIRKDGSNEKISANGWNWYSRSVLNYETVWAIKKLWLIKQNFTEHYTFRLTAPKYDTIKLVRHVVKCIPGGSYG